MSQSRSSYHIATDHAQLKSEYPEFGFIDPLRSKHDRENVLYNVPLHSNRIKIENDRHPYYMLHPSSQDRLRKAVESNFHTKYNKVEKIAKIQLLRSKLSKWQQLTSHHEPREINSVRRLMPELMQLTVPEDWFYRKGLQVLYTYLWYAQHRQLGQRFRQWKYLIDANRNLLGKMFSRWSWKACAWKLNKIKARRFVTLTRSLAESVRQANLAFYYYQWQQFDVKMQMRIKMKLLFRCWKTAVQSIVQRRKKAVRSAFCTLKDSVYLQHRKLQRIQSRHHQVILRRILFRWLMLLRKKNVLKRLFCERFFLLRGWNTWKYMLGKTLSLAPKMNPFMSPRPSSDPMQSTRVSYKAVYQSGSDQLVYRKVTTVTKSPRRPSRATLRSPAIPNLSSWRERFEWRLGVVKEIERSVVEHEEETKPLWMLSPDPRHVIDQDYSFSHSHISNQHTPQISVTPSENFTPLHSQGNRNTAGKKTPPSSIRQRSNTHNSSTPSKGYRTPLSMPRSPANTPKTPGRNTVGKSGRSPPRSGRVKAEWDSSTHK